MPSWRDDIPDRILAWVEVAAYGLVAVTLAVGGVVLLIDTVVNFIEHLGDGVPRAATDMLSALLLVFVFVELLGAVRVTIRERELIAEPFLLVGIIAAIKQIVVVAGAERPAEGAFDAFRNAMIEVGVLTGVVLVLAVCTLLLRARDREIEERD